MSDLAPFVAAVIRDRVVMDMQDEILLLKQKLYNLKQQTQCVSITSGGQNQDGCLPVIYAEANFVSNGQYDKYQPQLWKVEFPSLQQNSCSSYYCSLEDLSTLQINLGGITRARMSNQQQQLEGFVNDVTNNYNPQNNSGKISIWFGGGGSAGGGIWLTIQIQPISRHQYSALRDYDLSGGGGDRLVSTLQRFFTTHTHYGNQAPPIQVRFTDVSFVVEYMNGAMENWGLLNNNNTTSAASAATVTTTSRSSSSSSSRRSGRNNNGDDDTGGSSSSVHSGRSGGGSSSSRFAGSSSSSSRRNSNDVSQAGGVEATTTAVSVRSNNINNNHHHDDQRFSSSIRRQQQRQQSQQQQNRRSQQQQQQQQQQLQPTRVVLRGERVIYRVEV